MSCRQTSGGKLSEEKVLLSMRVVFQQSLAEVQERLVGIAEILSNTIDDATTAFGSSDTSLAETVIDETTRISQLTSQLDELTIDILARQQPVASDLRLMVSALRMSSSLERMGDLAQHIAELARYRYPESAVPKGFKKIFNRMAEADVLMASKVTALLRDPDQKLINEVRDLDDELDELHAKVFEKVLSDKLDGNPVGVVDATLASRYHERFGDHAVSIARHVQYMLDGTTE